MQRSIYDAGRGLSTATDALADLGLTMADLDGLSPDCRYAIFPYDGNTLGLCDLQAGQERPFPCFDELRNDENRVLFSPDSRYVIYSDDRRIWRRRLPE